MNYEDIIERLLNEKHITAKEAIYLLQLCSKQPQYVPYWPSYPEITYQTYEYKPYKSTTTDTLSVYNPYGYFKEVIV